MVKRSGTAGNVYWQMHFKIYLEMQLDNELGKNGQFFVPGFKFGFNSILHWKYTLSTDKYAGRKINNKILI